MAKRTFMTQGLTFTATAVSTALTNSTYMGLSTATNTQLVDVLEILISGMATASTVGAFQFSQVNTAAQTITALAAPHHDFGNNLAITSLSSAVTSFVAATTAPGATSVVAALVLNLGLNMFGGIIRWNAAPTQQVTMVGNSTAGGQMILYNNSTQGGGSSGLANAHIIYEPY
jgi:hypothetical protein